MTATNDDATDDAQPGWMVLPTPAHAAAWATPFPDFDPEGEWEPKAAVYDLNVAQMQRIAEREQEGAA